MTGSRRPPGTPWPWLTCTSASGSTGGISAFADIGVYNASTWALEGFSQALAAEVAPFGVKVTLIGPTGCSTDWGGPSARTATPLPEDDPVREQAAAARRARYTTPGDPRATRAAVLQVVDAEDPPLRIFLGDGPLRVATADYESRLAEWRAWEPVSVAAHGRR